MVEDDALVLLRLLLKGLFRAETLRSKGAKVFFGIFAFLFESYFEDYRLV
jgi:hypothetical protein